MWLQKTASVALYSAAAQRSTLSSDSSPSGTGRRCSLSSGLTVTTPIRSSSWRCADAASAAPREARKRPQVIDSLASRCSHLPWPIRSPAERTIHVADRTHVAQINENTWFVATTLNVKVLYDISCNFSVCRSDSMA